MKVEKILLIDDDADIRRLARVALETLGPWTVVEASAGEEGLRLAAEERPDVVLLDMLMPVLDGAATLRRLRDQPATASVPVILMTALAQRPDLLHLGAAGVLIKPFDPMLLADQIRRILKSTE